MTDLRLEILEMLARGGWVAYVLVGISLLLWIVAVLRSFALRRGFRGSLADLVTPIPCGVIMHDWWIALVAAAFGNVAHLDHATVRYRQHTGNDTGAKHWGPTYVAGQLTQVLRPTSKAADCLRSTQTQAACLLEAFEDRLTAQQRELVSDYANLSERTPLQRRVSLVHHGIFKTGAARNIGLFLSI